MAAKKQIDIKQTVSDEAVEEAAIKDRRSASLVNRKSERGVRKNRLTVLVPESLHEEVTLYAKASNRSVGDIVNELLEDLVGQDTAKERIEAARIFYRIADEKGRP